MIIDLSLVTIFLVSVFLLWYRISIKIPELVAIPDQVIAERLHEDSARLRFFLMHIKTYYREGRHKIYLWKFLAKTLYRLHVLLLKTDNAIVLFLKKVKANGGFANGINGVNGSGAEEEKDKMYWQKLQESSPASVSRSTRITEVRRRGS